MFKAQHPSQVFVSVIRAFLRDGSHLVVFLRVLSWSRLLAECEIRYLVAAFVALSCVWFWSRLWAEHEIRFCGVHSCGREASCSINVVCCCSSSVCALQCWRHCYCSRCCDAMRRCLCSLLFSAILCRVAEFSLRRTWNETGWTFMRSMFSVPSGGQAKNKDCGKRKCFFAKWFMNVLAPQALTAACLAAAFYEMAKIFRKHAAACIGAWNVFLLLEGVYGAATATVGFVTFGGDCCFSGAAVAHSNVCRPAAAKEGLITLEGVLWCSVVDCSICTLLVFTDAVCWPSVIAGYSFPLFSGKILFGILEVCWRVMSSRDSVSVLHGHVLGLRIEQAKVAVTFAFLFLLEALKGFHVFVRCFCVSEAEVVVQHAAAASEYMEEQPGVCKEVSVNALQAKATARVDVPETELEETEKVKQSFLVFLRTLQGRHHVLSCCAGMLVADLYEQVADACHMPCVRFMLVHQSKIV